MRILIVGKGFSGSVAAFDRRDDFVPGRVDGPADALEILDGTPAIVLLPIAGPKDHSLEWIARLTEKQGYVVVLSSVESAEIRAAAFGAGARDVVFPPLDSEAVEASVMGLSARPGRRYARFGVDLAATVSVGDVKIEGRARNISRGGLKVDLATEMPPATIVSVALKPAGVESFPVLYAHVAHTGASREGLRMHLRFVAMTAADQKILNNFLETLAPRLEDPATVLERLEELPLSFFRKRERRGLGVRVPQLTPIEVRWLAAAENTPEAALAEVTLGRCRISMIAALLEEHPSIVLDPHCPPLRFDAWRAEVAKARERIAGEISANLTADAVRLRELRDLRSRTNAASDHLDRVGEALTAVKLRSSTAGLQERATPVVFENARPESASSAPQPPPEVAASPARSRRNRVIFGSISIVALAAASLSIHRSAANRQDSAPVRDMIVQSPVAVSHGIQVQSFFRDDDGAVVAVVDGTWYRTEDPARTAALKEIARSHAKGTSMKVRDFAGTSLAFVGSDGKIHLGPAT